MIFVPRWLFPCDNRSATTTAISKINALLQGYICTLQITDGENNRKHGIFTVCLISRRCRLAELSQGQFSDAQETGGSQTGRIHFSAKARARSLKISVDLVCISSFMASNLCISI